MNLCFADIEWLPIDRDIVLMSRYERGSKEKERNYDCNGKAYCNQSFNCQAHEES